MQIDTTRFGIMQINEKLVIVFPDGIPGFEHTRRFVIIPVEGSGNMHWLQAVEEPALALLVIDPFKYFQDYKCELSAADIAKLEITDQKDALVLTTVTVPRNNPAGATTNLVAPIVINTKINKAFQIILNNSNYSTRHSLFPNASGGAPVHEVKETTAAGTGGV